MLLAEENLCSPGLIVLRGITKIAGSRIAVSAVFFIRLDSGGIVELI